MLGVGIGVGIGVGVGVVVGGEREGEDGVFGVLLFLLFMFVWVGLDVLELFLVFELFELLLFVECLGFVCVTKLVSVLMRVMVLTYIYFVRLDVWCNVVSCVVLLCGGEIC